MNLIGNSCFSSFIQRDHLKQEFENPFCWMYIEYKSMYCLINNYETLNFENVSLIKDKNWKFYIVIDNQVKLECSHYIFSPKDKSPRVNGNDIYYSKIWEYIIEKYEQRLQRMHNTPIFIIANRLRGCFYTYQQIESICELCTKKGYKCIIANNNIDISYKYPNIRFGKNPIKKAETEYTMKDFTDAIFPQIKDYLITSNATK